MSSIIQITGKRKEPCWISYIHSRIRNKKNFLGFIGGPTGSGKSWAALSICHMVDSTFNPERIITTMKDLMTLINSGKLKEGSAILWDEAGIDISNKAWQSLPNKMINFLMQTFRHQRFILIFTSPYLDFIDAGTRKLFHAEFIMSKIDYAEQKAKIKPYLIQYNARQRKFYYKYLRVKGLVGVAPVRIWSVPKPAQWLVDSYEEIKSKFTTNLNKEIEDQLNKFEEKKESKKEKEEEKKELTQIQEHVLQLMAQYDDKEKVANELGLNPRTIWFHLRAAAKKGYTKDNFMVKMLTVPQN